MDIDSFTLDLSSNNTDRFFIIGPIRGDYDRLIDLLYYQRFSFKDTLVCVGDFIDVESLATDSDGNQLNTMYFIKNTMNVYSVKGKSEFEFVNYIHENGFPSWLGKLETKEEMLSFIDTLPLVIKISDSLYVVNAGVQPNFTLQEQDPEVFYSIGTYDKDSRFYQFENPEEKSWFDFEIFDNGKLIKFCFGKVDAGNIELPAGYCLWREKRNKIVALILKKGDNSPIIIQQ